MGQMGGDATLQANDDGDPTPGPYIAPNPRGGRATREEFGQAGEWLACQAACRTRWRVMSERLGPLVAGTGHPLAHGPFADPERLGHATLGPAFLLEMPGLDPSGFLPVGR
jgi:hypothetical protein